MVVELLELGLDVCILLRPYKSVVEQQKTVIIIWPTSNHVYVAIWESPSSKCHGILRFLIILCLQHDSKLWHLRLDFVVVNDSSGHEDLNVSTFVLATARNGCCTNIIWRMKQLTCAWLSAHFMHLVHVWNYLTRKERIKKRFWNDL